MLSPFINKVYHCLKEKRDKQILIFILILLIGAPALINGVIHINGATNMYSGWSALYSVAYYVIGGYIAEYRPKIKVLYLIGLIIGTCALHSIIIFTFSPDGLFRYYAGNYERVEFYYIS